MPSRGLVFFSAFVSVALFFGSCSGKTEASRTEFVLDTVCTITLFDQGKDSVYKDCFDRLHEIENRMSVTLPDSDLAHVNKAAGRQPVQVHDDVFRVIDRALYYAELSGGAMDPTVEPLVTLWGVGTDNARVPSQEEIDAVIPLINWRDVELDRENKTVFLKRPGMALDLGAIAKGFAADEVAVILKKDRVKRAIIDLGGNILTYGEKADKSPWKVGLQSPFDERGQYLGIVTGPAQTVVTSGVYERYFEYDGVLYHHLLDPATGYPTRNELLAVTIITGASFDGDGLSTPVFVMGYEKGRALVESLKGVEAIFVFDDMTVRKTKGANFTLTDDRYRLLDD